MRSVYLFGRGLNASYIKENKENKLRLEILLIEEYLMMYAKKKGTLNIVKTDSKMVKAYQYFDDEKTFLINENQNLVTYKNEIEIASYDLIVANQITDFIRSYTHVLKFVKLSIEDYKKSFGLKNSIYIITTKLLEELKIHIKGLNYQEIIRQIDSQVKGLDKAIFLLDDLYIIYEDKTYQTYFYQIKHIIGTIDVIVSGIIMEYEYSLEDALKFGVKLAYYYGEYGFLRKEDALTQALKSDIDFLRIKKKDNPDDSELNNIIRFGNDGIRQPFYNYKDIVIFDQKIINQHQKLQSMLNEKTLVIKANYVLNIEALDYLRPYFSDLTCYENLTNIEEIISRIQNENIYQKKPVFYFENCSTSLKEKLLVTAKKGFFETDTIPKYINQYVLIFYDEDKDASKYDLIIDPPSFDYKPNLAIILRKHLKKYSHLFIENECHIDQEVIDCFLKGKLLYQEKSIEKILALSDLSHEFFSYQDFPPQDILDLYLNLKESDDITNFLANKMSSFEKRTIDSLYLNEVSRMLDSLASHNLYYRSSVEPIEFDLTDKEIEALAKVRYQENDRLWDFLNEKEKAKHRFLIKKIPRFLNEIGYELYFSKD